MAKKGELVMISSGSYSDYSVSAVAVAKTDFDIREEALAFIKHNDWKIKPNDYFRYCQGINPSAFIAWLVKRGIVSEIDSEEFNVDDVSSQATAAFDAANGDDGES